MSSSSSSRRRPDADYAPVSSAAGDMSGLTATIRKPKVLLPSLVLLLLLVAGVCVIVYLAAATDTFGSSAEFKGKCLSSVSDSQTSPPPQEVLARGHEDFSARLYRVLAGQNSDNNLIFSPVSLSSVLALASVGAKGSSLSELRDALSLPCDERTTLEGFKYLTAKLQGGGGAEMDLSLANRMFLNKGFDLLDSFSQKAQEFFRAVPETLDFAKDESRVSINSWVESQTNDRIKDLLVPGSLTDEMRMVLVNAVYFKGKWKTPFDPLLTERVDFKGGDDGGKVLLMSLPETKFRVGRLPAEVAAAQVIKLPYVGDRVYMYVVLPDENATLADVEDNLEQVLASDLDSHLSKGAQSVNLFLPKFKLENTLDLTGTVANLGAKDIFIPRSANFSGLTSDYRGLVVSEIVQKAFAEVNEEGTEAAAATGVTFRMTSFRQSVDFRCDRPFLFLIREENTGVTLFAGRFVRPQ